MNIQKNEKITFKDYGLIISLSGWLSIICIIIFFINIIAGKIMHLKRISIDSPINGPSEFFLFCFIIIQFSIYVLLKERKQNFKTEKKG